MCNAITGYEVRPREDRRRFDLISDRLPFGRLWYAKPDDAIGATRSFSAVHTMPSFAFIAQDAPVGGAWPRTSDGDRKKKAQTRTALTLSRELRITGTDFNKQR
jgi:hypothetical protein